MKSMHISYITTTGETVTKDISGDSHNWVADLTAEHLEGAAGIERIIGNLRDISHVEDLSFVAETGETISIPD